ncbi:unnamed protein product [Candida parapsilosis]
MRLHIFQLLAFIVSICSADVFFPGSFKDNTLPLLPPVCTEDKLYCETTYNPTYFMTTFNAAFVVSESKRNIDSSFSIVINYQADKYDQLYNNFLQNIGQIHLTGTGTADPILYSYGIPNTITNPFRWSARIQVTTQVKNGKCCTRDGMRLWYTFRPYGTGYAALYQVFGTQQIYYTTNAWNGAVQQYDPMTLFNQQLLFQKREEEKCDAND